MILDELEFPIICAPLAGGPSTTALAVAVSEAGGLGFLASGYRSARSLGEQIRDVRALTSKPFGVNVFVPADRAIDEEALDRYRHRLELDAAYYGVAIGDPRGDDDDLRAKVEVLLTERPAVASFTFGCPPPWTVEALHRADIAVWVTVTGTGEADAAGQVGADALVVQGTEAGGHRGGFTDQAGESLSLLPLLRLVAAECDLPVVAAGGIADGAAVAAVLAAGASAAQMGSAFMLAEEAGTDPAHRELLATDRPTAVTRAFTGRPARGLVNRFLDDHAGQAPAAYPQVHHMTSPIRAAARARGDAEGFNLWAGQAHRLARRAPAREIVESLATELQAALASAALLARVGSNG